MVLIVLLPDVVTFFFLGANLLLLFLLVIINRYIFIDIMLQNIKEAWLTYPYHCCAFHFPKTHNPQGYADHEVKLSNGVLLLHESQNINFIFIYIILFWSFLTITNSKNISYLLFFLLLLFQKLKQKMFHECKNLPFIDPISTVKTMHSTTENFIGEEMFHTSGKHLLLKKYFTIILLL